MTCSCMYLEGVGVRHEGPSTYVCAGCGKDCTRSFLCLMDVDEAFADYLIERGKLQPKPLGPA